MALVCSLNEYKDCVVIQSIKLLNNYADKQLHSCCESNRK
jgi:hypothetical protein